jgi:hypothetical protein
MIHPLVLGVLAAGVNWGGDWKWAGNFTLLDLIAAATNALNGALLCRHPRPLQELHPRRGHADGPGRRRDSRRAGESGPRRAEEPRLPHHVRDSRGGRILPGLREGPTVPGEALPVHDLVLLPMYAIVGAQKGVSAELPVAGVLVLAVIGPTAGRWFVDASSGVPPKHFVRGEWFVAIALLTGIIWFLCYTAGLNTWASAAVALVIGYTVRVVALYRTWEEPLASEPKGVYIHDDGRPQLGRKLKGKSQRELAYLGLATDQETRPPSKWYQQPE